MNVYKIDKIADLLKDNTYPGRGIINGKSADGKKAVFAYFIMGRSDNSRNRVFVKTEDGIMIKPFDESKVEDPSLIIYYPVRRVDNKVIATNGDQTDTIYDFINDGKCFNKALKTRKFEPDGPNWTPRISSMLTLGKEFSYKMSILKSADLQGTACNRYTYDFEPVNGLGHFIHTYVCDGNPIPTFQGEPERVEIPNCIECFTKDIWENLNPQNKISLYVEYIDLESGKIEYKLINKFN
ncbi:MAG: IMP cyclohydrolase [Clostridia bacterium]|nr:IMP cyclohydrolase [Clostridia bacterium]